MGRGGVVGRGGWEALWDRGIGRTVSLPVCLLFAGSCGVRVVVVGEGGYGWCLKLVILVVGGWCLCCLFCVLAFSVWCCFCMFFVYFSVSSFVCRVLCVFSFCLCFVDFFPILSVMFFPSLFFRSNDTTPALRCILPLGLALSGSGIQAPGLDCLEVLTEPDCVDLIVKIENGTTLSQV